MPDLSVTGVRLVVPDHIFGLPVLRALSLCTCCRQYPGTATVFVLALSHSRISLPRFASRVDLRIVLFEDCSAFTHVAACTLALSPYFVTTITRRLQPCRYLHNRSGCYWLEPWPGGTYTHRKAPPFHGAQRKLTNRAYTPAQIQLILDEANPKLHLSICLAESAGLRAMELITISLPEHLPESQRDAWRYRRFAGRESESRFVVHGKGGLCREVRLPRPIASRLMTCMRPYPIVVRDRGVNHQSFFNLTSGVNFSEQFSNLSKNVLNMSLGAHGLRHSFSQKRLHDLICQGLSFEDALHVLSNELGHFSTNNTFAYLRD